MEAKQSLGYEIVGWLGVLLVLLAYSLVTVEVLLASSPVYLMLNSIGALALTTKALKQRSWQFVALNVVWLAIALYGFRGLL